ncbi:MAG: inorganic phosphate transporter, partial [Candidatus Omnitrophica bacterium]|nr:inorganic phosphate transporter [Candidatus Omnitrophota bacterium]
IPISTTHGLTGALVGVGFIASGTELGFNALGKYFLIPLIVSPFMALVLTTVIYFVMHQTRQVLGITRKSCLCIGKKIIPLTDLGLENGHILTSAEIKLPEIFVGSEESCQAKAIEIYEGNMFGVSAQSVLDFLHFLSAGAVSFARGLNDTPKIVALLVASSALGLGWNVGFVALAMAVGGILSARRVAETLSHKITYMNHGQGFTANLVTAVLVIFASNLGMPVSTTHVSCGALFGIGLVNGKARWNVIGGIISAWVLTLPVSAVLAGGFYWIFQ